MKKEIKGINPAMVTPFNEKEEIDEAALRRLVNYFIGNGVHGLVPTGSQGEFFALTNEERRRVWEVVVDEAAGRVPVYAGTAAITTRQVIELNRLAGDTGVDALLVLTPYFVQPTQEELYRHYMDVADAAPLPILLYTNPARAGVKLSTETVARLSTHPNIVGVKDSTGDLVQTIEFVRRTGPDFSVLVGNDALIHAGLHHGIKGSISAAANVVPALLVEVYRAFLEGDVERSRTAQEKMLPLRLAFGLGTFPGMIKEALNMMGVSVGPARRPVGPMTDEARGKLREVLKQIGVI